mmetsp:Transcript_16633/g.47908  ORF Transcript_16633/g.47908 Transcript_16633/m.47908 type:complete len:117 (-) Transcript_16633:184-534(-)
MSVSTASFSPSSSMTIGRSSSTLESKRENMAKNANDDDAIILAAAIASSEDELDDVDLKFPLTFSWEGGGRRSSQDQKGGSGSGSGSGSGYVGLRAPQNSTILHKLSLKKKITSSG